MTRRDLIKSMMAAMVLDPERLLYVPGRRHISIPTQPVAYLVWRTRELGFLSGKHGHDPGISFPIGPEILHFEPLWKDGEVRVTEVMNRPAMFDPKVSVRLSKHGPDIMSCLINKVSVHRRCLAGDTFILKNKVWGLPTTK